ncbi:MAG TPA: Holliday junction resolvase [Anaerolineae bacterium]|nr:Holliday junction resolvase [Anaerolineae bacterium]
MGDSLLILLFIALLLLGIAIVAAIILAYKYLSVRGQIIEQARREFEQWRARELATVKQESLETARREMLVEFEQWKSRYEQTIRQDAIQKSQAVTLGKITEHFIPYLPDFSYNPKDARFIGSPIDFVVFDGLHEKEVRKVVFVEVKTGTSGLTTRERRIRDAIRSGNVEWIELRPAFKACEPSVEIDEEQVEP